jgi:hypothetical protein
MSISKKSSGGTRSPPKAGTLINLDAVFSDPAAAADVYRASP